MMTVKDYYQVLNVSPSATTEQIKKAFRKLALRYHPDKNINTELAARKFVEIQEAYQVLKDRAKRTAYNYQRYRQNPQQIFRPLAERPEDVLQLSTSLHQRLSLLDPYRIDLDLLAFEIADLLSAHNLQVLQSMADPFINKKIIHQVLASLGPLPLPTARNMLGRLKMLAQQDALIERELNSFEQQMQWQHYWRRYKIYIALLIALLFCTLLFFSGKKMH